MVPPPSARARNPLDRRRAAPAAVREPRAVLRRSNRRRRDGTAAMGRVAGDGHRLDFPLAAARRGSRRGRDPDRPRSRDRSTEDAANRLARVNPVGDRRVGARRRARQPRDGLRDAPRTAPRARASSTAWPRSCSCHAGRRLPTRRRRSAPSPDGRDHGPPRAMVSSAYPATGSLGACSGAAQRCSAMPLFILLALAIWPDHRSEHRSESRAPARVSPTRASGVGAMVFDRPSASQVCRQL